MTTQRKSMNYYWLSEYDLMETHFGEFLKFKKKYTEDPTNRRIPLENTSKY